jgi:hypothetical protein
MSDDMKMQTSSPSETSVPSDKIYDILTQNTNHEESHKSIRENSWFPKLGSNRSFPEEKW